jgi:carbonic anhydrase/acetyltransferase-like protein (isoleucine patch superfamily)
MPAGRPLSIARAARYPKFAVLWRSGRHLIVACCQDAFDKGGQVVLYALGERVPSIDDSAYVHPNAVIIGSVKIGANSSVWPGAVLRGDYGEITIGARTSIQDGTVIHATHDLGTTIGDDCVVGHNAHLEGCIVEDKSLIGSGSVVLHRAVVRTGALVGAGAVVPNDMEVPSAAMALGVPAKLKADAVPPGVIQVAVDVYVENGARYKTDLRRLD